MRRVNTSDDVVRLLLSPRGMGVLLAATGCLVWIALSVWGGLADQESGFRLREAWDNAAYLTVGLPIMTLAVALAGFVRPRRAWRWPLWLVGGHQLGMLLCGLGMQSGFSLILLTLILAILMVALFAVPALLGAMAGRRLMETVQ